MAKSGQGKDRKNGAAERRPFLARLLADRRGNTLALAGAALVPIAAMIGSGLDMSRAYMAEARLQNACDAAALAARRYMEGTNFTNAAEREGERFFDFNFREGTMNAQNVSVEIEQSEEDSTEIEVRASADIPTTLMSMFGKASIPVAVECNADYDLGNNDVMLVLDVTGSMNDCPGGGRCNGNSNSKIARLRTAASDLYNALATNDGSRTRFGIMPYSVTVNVGADLRNKDILFETYYWQEECVYIRSGRYGGYWSCDWNHTPVHVNETSYHAIQQWRTSGRACIEERPTYGRPAYPISISTSVSREDIDVIAQNNGNDENLQWGRYDPNEQEITNSGACPSAASRLRTYSTESSFDSAINAATANVGGNTYHDIGMMWGARYLSSTGMFASDNQTTYDGVPVHQHIIFLTDGIMQPSSSVYSAYGVESEDHRLGNSGSLNSRHVARFQAACNRAKAMGMTVWVIALDVADTSDIEPCATSSDHFYVSNGSDLDDVFATIGQGIGRLRLTR